MRVLAIGAHFDDLELGCGGALARHAREGDQVWGFVATQSGYTDAAGQQIRDSSRAYEEALKASSIIGYQLLAGGFTTFCVDYGEETHQVLLKMIEKHRIDTIYTHWIHDIHHDHRNLALATLHCARHVSRILMYRSNWYSSETAFHENFFVDISDTWEFKENALKAYQTEMCRTGNGWLDYFKRQAENYGMQCGVKYAECFQIIKWMR